MCFFLTVLILEYKHNKNLGRPTRCIYFSKNSPVLTSFELQYVILKVHIRTEDKPLVKCSICLKSDSVLKWMCENKCIKFITEYYLILLESSFEKIPVTVIQRDTSPGYSSNLYCSSVPADPRFSQTKFASEAIHHFYCMLLLSIKSNSSEFWPYYLLCGEALHFPLFLGWEVGVFALHSILLAFITFVWQRDWAVILCLSFSMMLRDVFCFLVCRVLVSLFHVWKLVFLIILIARSVSVFGSTISTWKCRRSHVHKILSYSSITNVCTNLIILLIPYFFINP